MSGGDIGSQRIASGSPGAASAAPPPTSATLRDAAGTDHRVIATGARLPRGFGAVVGFIGLAAMVLGGVGLSLRAFSPTGEGFLHVGKLGEALATGIGGAALAGGVVVYKVATGRAEKAAATER